MSTSNDEHGKPVLNAEKAPYGHADEPPMASVFPEMETPPVVSVPSEGLHDSVEAIHPFASDDMPLFPPVNVGIANAEDPPLLPEQPHKSAEAQSTDKQQEADFFRSFVKARPLASILAAASFGAVFVAGLMARAGDRR